jgi:protein-L-isoaspartate(D-aspartate) O-methyltransferase
VTNVTVELGNGAQGWANGAPFDVIVISGALEVLPEVFLKQVKVGGRIAAIIGVAPAMSANIITRVSETAYDTVKVFETEVRYLKSAETPSHFEF